MFSSGRIDSQTLIMQISIEVRKSSIFPTMWNTAWSDSRTMSRSSTHGVYGTIDELESSLKEFFERMEILRSGS